jgi:hypothetical protein
MSCEPAIPFRCANAGVNQVASDEHVATALRAFADALIQGWRNGGTSGGSLSEEHERRNRLKGLSERVQAMAKCRGHKRYHHCRRKRIYSATACKLAHQLI